MILDKVKPSLFLPIVMSAWGVVSTCTGAVHNYEGLIALRFLLGFVEAPFFPAALFLLSSWYTKKELAARISILFAAGQMAGAFGGLLGSAIMSGMGGAAGLPAWRWLFLIEGVIVFPVALAAMFVLPNYPEVSLCLKGARCCCFVFGRMLIEAIRRPNGCLQPSELLLSFVSPKRQMKKTNTPLSALSPDSNLR